MSKWRYAILGGATVAWVGCADLPSFPDNLGQTVGTGGGSSAGSSSTPSGGSEVIPNAGTTSSTGGGTPMGGSASEGGSTNTGGSATDGKATGGEMSTGGMAMGGMTTGMGGMTMTDPKAEIDDAVKNLKMWRFENPCKAFNAGCQPSDICWEDSVNSSKAFKHASVIQIGGVVGHQYDVTLRVRGVIEPRDYPSKCPFLTGGNTQNGATISIIENCDGYENSGMVGFNIWQFKIAEPAHVYYFNAVKTHPNHRVDTIDQTFTIRVAGGTKINWDYDDLNGGQIRNCTNTVPGIAPYPNVYDGQYVQLDVADAKLVQ